MKKSILLLTVSVLLMAPALLSAQMPKRYNSSEIYKKLKKLNVLGNALYIAAHPDDENTRLITYLSNAELVNTAYLSLTRGDGGQNSIGPEQSELLGIVRTQELLSARKVDGGTQFFTRVMDFGYSKSAGETLNIWNKEEILEDVIWIIRKFRPDVIITRFPADHRAGHGQHETSALVAGEAFVLAADPAVFPEQLKYVDIWKPSRLFTNTGIWWMPEISESDSVISVDIGTYDPLTGLSYSELGADSRSKHRSQAFGVTWSRGTSKEYLELVKGKEISSGIFGGIDISWSRLGRPDLEDNIEEIINNYDFTDPSASLGDLIDLRKKIKQLDNPFWKKIKLDEIDEIVKASLGLYMEATSGRDYLSPEDTIDIRFEFTNRSNALVTLTALTSKELSFDSIIDRTIEYNKPIIFHAAQTISDKVRETSPFWLAEPVSNYKYQVDDISLKGLAENPPSISFDVILDIGGESIDYRIPVVYTWTDRMKGQQYEPIEIGPKIFAEITEGVFIFPDSDPKEVTIKVESRNQEVNGSVTLEIPHGWRLQPSEQDFGLAPYSTEEFMFTLYPPAESSNEVIKAVVVTNGGKNYDRKYVTVDYDHFPRQSIYLMATAKVVRLDIGKKGNHIAYVPGAGDEVGEALEQIGYKVTYIDADNIRDMDLQNFDAIVFGIMAFNNLDYLADYEEDFLKYIREGGNIIVQYNNIRIGLKSPILKPYPIEFSGSSASVRVSVEDAEVQILAPDHEVMNVPNKIGQADFNGWIQERGLYFPLEWDSKYTAILSSHDPGEEPLKGGLLVTDYGKGHYIYTSYSWFRQLPAGVPGAFRIFANFISIGKDQGSYESRDTN